MNKKCTKCHQILLLEQFGKNKSKSNGYESICRNCDATRSKKYYQEHKAKVIQRHKKYYRKNKARILEKAKTYYKNNREISLQRDQKYANSHPLHIIAKNKLEYAVKSGKIAVQNCEECGVSPDKAKIHGHHEDYNRPLDVKWLCVPCHLSLHGKRRIEQVLKEKTNENNL